MKKKEKTKVKVKVKVKEKTKVIDKGNDLDNEFIDILKEFVDTTRGMRVMLPELVTIVGGLNKIYLTQVKKIEDEIKSGTKNVNSEYQRVFEKLKNSYHLYNKLPESIFISIVCQFDYLVANLVKIIYREKPNILSTNEKNITLSELDEYETIEDFKDYYVDKEISNLTYKGLRDIYAWLARKLGVSEFDELLDIYPLIIEVIQRRHVFVHHGSKVSRQYIKLSSNPYKLKMNDRIKLTQEYIYTAYSTILKVAVKTLFMVWYSMNKSIPLFIEINNFAFESIATEKYEIAIDILEFGLGLDVGKKVLKDDVRTMLVLNLAQAYKWSGNKAKCMQLIEKTDWTAMEDKFKICFYCLKEEYDDAGMIMKQIGKNGSIKEEEYLEWPIFKEFRDTKQLQSTYLEVFNRNYCTQANKVFEGIKINYIVSHSQEEFEMMFPEFGSDVSK